MASDKPTCLALDDGSHFRLLYVNEEFQKEVKRAPAVFKQIVNEWNKPESEIAKRLHAFAQKVDQGEASYFDFKQTEQYLRLSAQQIARHENYQMLLINVSGAIPKISKKQSFGCSFFYFQPVKKLKVKNFKKTFYAFNLEKT
ncbi:hypothetical protein [Lactobacillus delbrueckii]|uniref:hypothetical protein n=1 Tax=Lactobacillus delbrueckii TaxID=1584 RepID=UPI0037CB5C1B